MGLNLCWIQIRGTLSVWLETKAWTGNPYCINLRDQTPLSASAPPGSVRPGINPHAQAVSYGYRIQTWSCDMAPTLLCCCCVLSRLSLALNGSPAGPQCSGLTGQAPTPQIPQPPCPFRVWSPAYGAAETPEGSWQRTKVKDIPLPHCHLYSVCLFVNYISNGGHNKT